MNGSWIIVLETDILTLWNGWKHTKVHDKIV